MFGRGRVRERSHCSAAMRATAKHMKPTGWKKEYLSFEGRRGKGWGGGGRGLKRWRGWSTNEGVQMAGAYAAKTLEDNDC